MPTIQYNVNNNGNHTLTTTYRHDNNIQHNTTTDNNIAMTIDNNIPMRSHNNNNSTHPLKGLTSFPPRVNFKVCELATTNSGNFGRMQIELL